MNADLWEAHLENKRLRRQVVRLQQQLWEQRVRTDSWRTRALRTKHVEVVYRVEVKEQAA